MFRSLAKKAVEHRLKAVLQRRPYGLSGTEPRASNKKLLGGQELRSHQQQGQRGGQAQLPQGVELQDPTLRPVRLFNTIDQGAAMSEFANRRAFLGGAAALAAGAIVPRGVLEPRLPAAAAARQASPTPSSTGCASGALPTATAASINSAEDTLKALIQDGLSEVELMGGPIQAYAGLGGGGRKGVPRSSRRSRPTPSARRNWPSAGSCARCTTMRA